jgi:hypothetical protein
MRDAVLWLVAGQGGCLPPSDLRGKSSATQFTLAKDIFEQMKGRAHG